MTTIIIGLIKGFKGIASFLLPDQIFVSDIFTNFDAYVTWFTDFLVTANFLVPLPTIFDCLEIIVTIKIIKFTIFIANWLARAALDVIP